MTAENIIALVTSVATLNTTVLAALSYLKKKDDE